MADTPCKGRVLVLDDESAVCELLSERLSMEGYVCQACSSAKEALAVMEQESFDVVLSDIRMPGMSG
ncbi:MAG: response regulator, partial [Acidobacteriia bacterium]|nr:response regulator [Terriglobia bacterium]